MKRIACLVLTAASLTTGCATAKLDTPSGFASHDPGSAYDIRVSDGEGVVLAVRSEKNRPSGDLQYWSSALDVQLRSAGYQAKEVQDVESADGHAGKQLRYELHDAGRTLDFWLSVFVTDRRVIVVEAGGDQSFFEDKQDQVEAAIASLRVG